MSAISCMGGWCGRRESCARHEPGGQLLYQRLCPAGAEPYYLASRLVIQELQPLALPVDDAPDDLDAIAGDAPRVAPLIGVVAVQPPGATFSE